MTDTGDTARRAGMIVGFVAVFALAIIVSGGYLSDAHTVDGPGTIGAPSGPAITIQGTTDINLSDPPSAGQLKLRTADGNATFTSAGVTNATIHVDDLDGSWTNLTALDVSTALKVDAEGMAPFRVQGGDTDSIAIAATRAADDGVVDFEYSGPSGTTELELWAVNANTQYGAVDRDTHTVLDSATSNGSGVVDFSLPNSAHSVTLQTSDGGPTVSNLEPDGGTIRYDNETLTADIDDPDFPSDNVTVEFYLDGSLVNTVDAGSAGSVSTQVTGLSEGSHSWHVEAIDSYGAKTTSATESFTVDHYDPRVTDASPTGPQSQFPSQLSVTVDDDDFGNDGDQLDVTFYYENTQVGTDTLTSAGTATASISSAKAGPNDWRVEIEDQYGQWTNESYQFSSPEELRVLNESAPTKLVDDVTVSLRFYEADGEVGDIYDKQTSDGTINMTGLPASSQFVVVAKADTYINRRIFVPSLFKQQQVYLLPQSKSAVETIFSMTSYSGDFPQDSSVLEVQRALNGSWQTVVGDYFGATGEFQTQLRTGVRHRLVVRNPDTGQTRVLGTYTALAASEQSITITPEGVKNISGPAVTSEIKPGARTLPAEDDVPVSASVRPGSDTAMANFSIDIYYDEINGGNVSLNSKISYNDDGGSLASKVDLANRDAGQLKVIFEYYTKDGSHNKRVATYRVQDTTASQYSLLSVLASFATLVAPAGQSAFQVMLALTLSIMLTGVIAARQRLPTEMIGIIHVGFITAFSILGWVGYQLLFVIVVGWGALAFLGRRY